MRCEFLPQRLQRGGDRVGLQVVLRSESKRCSLQWATCLGGRQVCAVRARQGPGSPQPGQEHPRGRRLQTKRQRDTEMQGGS